MMDVQIVVSSNILPTSVFGSQTTAPLLMSNIILSLERVSSQKIWGLFEAIRFLLLTAAVGSALNLFNSLAGLITGACVV